MAKTNIRRIGVLTGGGDCPGLNPAIKWVVKTAEDELVAKREGREPFEVLGLRDGWKGLIEADDPEKVIIQPRTDFRPNTWARMLTEDDVRTWDRLGGTRLGTSRTNPFSPKDNKSEQVIKNIEMLKLDAIVAIGGEDTLGVAYKLANMNIPIVGIPKTIDKDLPGTDYSLGFETAINVIVEEIDRLRTTAGSHSRIFVVETMGRHAGHLALQGGMASGAYIILIPEHKFNLNKVCELLWSRRERGARYSIVVAAEAARDDEGQIEKLIKERERQREEQPDQFGHLRVGGVVHAWLTDAIERWAKERKCVKLETRSVDLSHLQRGGSPSAYDRRMGRSFGIAAVNLLVRGEFGRMVSFRNGKVTSISFKDAIGELTSCTSEEEKIKHLNLVTEEEYDPERYNGKRWVFPVPK